jgi:UDP-N-acetylglucosamine 2-epimerase (non-hydrolysing)
MKAAPVWQAIANQGGCEQILVHTGQHYDVNMSDVFLADLGLPAPNRCLAAGSGSHAQQTAAVMVAFEQVVGETRPDLVVVYGDVNSTLAAALVCAKCVIPVAHVEAGLRSGDRTMPEEINRLLTDQIADWLFTPSPDADENLLREGILKSKIHRVGNVMIDSLARLLPAAKRSTVLADLGLQPHQYAVVTLHRPANVDDVSILARLLDALSQMSHRLPIAFPVHPRTRQRLAACLPQNKSGALRTTEPLGYVDFLRLLSEARIVVTDSGGIQEETTYLGIPCLTMRTNTERPITVERGTNVLVGNDVGLLTQKVHAILDGDTSWNRRAPSGIPLWDGHAADRIAPVLLARRA